MVRTIGFALLLLGAAIILTGCASSDKDTQKKNLLWRYPHSRMETFAQSPDDHQETVWRTWDHDRRGLAEDLDLLFMTDRNNRLTHWHDH